MSAFFLDGADLADGIALCLSGGGYRAMLYHAGAIWRLDELGVLRKIKLISSVSGGSITSGALAVAWKDLTWDEATGRASNLREKFLEPILRQAVDAIDYKSIALGLLPWDHAFRHVAKSYARNITGGAKDAAGPPATTRVRLQHHELDERAGLAFHPRLCRRL